MKKSLISLILLLLSAAALYFAYTRLPAMKEAQTVYEREAAATPTPTSDTSSMMLVTRDPSWTPAPTAFVLKNGSKGPDVKKLQTRLQALGWYSGTADGQYGPGTAEAVTAFQKQHGLEADGIAGESTLAKLYSDTAGTPAPSSAPTAAPTTSLLKKGANGDDVKKLQQRLLELGYYSGKVDGDFGNGTEDALRLFQNQNGLVADGVAAAKTFSVLYSDSAKKISITPTPDPDAMPILINRTHTVDASYKPSNLVTLKNVLPSSLVTMKGSDIQGDMNAVKALEAMFRAAAAQDVTDWQISAGYRSYSYQKKLFDKNVQEYLDKGFTKSNAISATRQTVADPGTSEHHSGLAFDITVPGTTFKGTKQQKWLAANCWDYGFVIRYQEDKEKITGYIAECWHIRYVGLPHSKIMYTRNQCLEEYLGMTD